MNKDSSDADRALLKSLGFQDDLIDSPSGTRMIQVLFGDEGEEDHWIEESPGIDRGFACVA
jgi:hypothetical protein